MKNILLILSLIIVSCSSQTNTDNYVGTWIPDGNGNKYSKIVIEKADNDELRMVVHNRSTRWNFIMVPENPDKIKSTESVFGTHMIFKFDDESQKIVDYNLNQKYKMQE